jgi:hypothetical protein
MVVILMNGNSNLDLDSHRKTSTVDYSTSMALIMHSQHLSRDDPPSPPPQPPPSPASWNRLLSVRCVTRRHPSILTLHKVGRPYTSKDLNPGVIVGFQVSTPICWDLPPLSLA